MCERGCITVRVCVCAHTCHWFGGLRCVRRCAQVCERNLSCVCARGGWPERFVHVHVHFCHCARASMCVNWRAGVRSAPGFRRTCGIWAYDIMCEEKGRAKYACVRDEGLSKSMRIVLFHEYVHMFETRQAAAACVCAFLASLWPCLPALACGCGCTCLWLCLPSFSLQSSSIL